MEGRSEIASIPILLRAARAVAGRPDLWPTALRAAADLRRTGWWRRPPFLPVPDPAWLRFRLVTAYGGEGTLDATTPLEAEELLTWLEWRRDW